jgi:UDP-N-acetylglucosamine acyltransferase
MGLKMQAKQRYLSIDIHKTAIVDPSAQIGEGCVIGPHVYIGPEVKIGQNNIIMRNADISGWVTMGDNNKIYPYAAIGGDPQDRSYQGEIGWLNIGSNNVMREFSTISRGTKKGGGKTNVGNDNMFMAYSHIGHDCQIGNDITLVNSANLAGHVHVQDSAFVGGLVSVHQHVTIGKLSIIGLNSPVTLDVPPFTMATGHPAALRGINVVGLVRHGYDQFSIDRLRVAYSLLFRKQLKLFEKIDLLQERGLLHDDVIAVVEFLVTSRRGYLRHYMRSAEEYPQLEQDKCYANDINN